jgi:hypothetical protein
MSYVTITNCDNSRLAPRVVITVVMIASALIGVGPANAQQEVEPTLSRSFSAAINKFDAVDTNEVACLSATAFQDIPGMLVSFKSGGAGSRPVAVLFQGVLADRGVEARLTIDGVVQSGPSNVVLNFANPPSAGTRGFNFLSDPLPPGLHVARIQWRTVGFTCIQDRSLIVLHR